MTSTLSIPCSLNSAIAASSITSPLTTTGTAGGHDTVGDASTRPSESQAATVYFSASTALRGEHATFGGANDMRGFCSALRTVISENAASILKKSVSLL